MATVNWSFAQIIDTAQTLYDTNPVLQNGQLGIEEDSFLFKVGNGTAHWNDLAYAMINSQQSVWVGKSANTKNLITRDATDGGMLLSSDLFTNATEVMAAINGTGTLDELDSTAPLKAAVYRMGVIVRTMVAALGPDFASIKSGAYTGNTLQQLLATITAQVAAVSGLISDSEQVAGKTWSSNKINTAIASAVSTAIANLVGAAPAALDTIYELAATLAENQNLVTTITQDLGTTIRYTTQSLTTGQQAQVRANIGAVSIADLGTYAEIGGKTLLQHFNEALGLSVPAESLAGDFAVRLAGVETRTQMNGCSMFKSFMDADTGQYTLIEWKRADGSVAMSSELSGTSAAGDKLYSTRTEKYYAANGTLVKTIVYTLTYDNMRNVISEQITT